jgi:hypothetical protein
VWELVNILQAYGNNKGLSGRKAEGVFLNWSIDMDHWVRRALRTVVIPLVLNREYF